MGHLGNLQRQPTVRAEQAALQSECGAAWHRTVDGAWVELHSAADVDERWEQTAISLAASCEEREVGERMVTEVGSITLVATRKADGVWVGIRDQNGEAITLISALHRTKTRVRSRIDLPAIPRVELPEVASRVELPAIAPSADLPAVASHAELPAVAHRAESRAFSEVEPAAFVGPNLDEVVSYLNAVTDMTSRYADRTIICDYWNLALEDSCIVEVAPFDVDKGFVAAGVGRTLTRDERDALDDAFASWKLRIRLAIGTIYTKIPLLKTPPWR